MASTLDIPLVSVSSLQAFSATSSVLPASKALAGRWSTKVKSRGAGSEPAQPASNAPSRHAARTATLILDIATTPTLPGSVCQFEAQDASRRPALKDQAISEKS